MLVLECVNDFYGQGGSQNYIAGAECVTGRKKENGQRAALKCYAMLWKIPSSHAWGRLCLSSPSRMLKVQHSVGFRQKLKLSGFYRRAVNRELNMADLKSI